VIRPKCQIEMNTDELSQPPAHLLPFNRFHTERMTLTATNAQIENGPSGLVKEQIVSGPSDL
jgi:hypothetical protein